MRSIHVPLAACAALGIFLFVQRGASHPADAVAGDASDCMNFRNDVQEKSIVLHASNLCDRKFSCSISYVVRCEDHTGKETSHRNGRAQFSLAERAAAEVSLSAEQCLQGWTIGNVAWVCR